MSQYVTDTHAIIWHLVNDRRLSSRARQVFTETDAGQLQASRQSRPRCLTRSRRRGSKEAGAG